MIKSHEDARAELLRILDHWQSGNFKSPWEIQDEAEQVEESLWDLGLISETPSVAGIGAIVEAVLGVMTCAYFQRILPVDIPVIHLLLMAESGREMEAIENFQAYWDGLDSKERENEATSYWLDRCAT